MEQINFDFCFYYNSKENLKSPTNVSLRQKKERRKRKEFKTVKYEAQRTWISYFDKPIEANFFFVPNVTLNFHYECVGQRSTSIIADEHITYVTKQVSAIQGNLQYFFFSSILKIFTKNNG